ncbi:hypothetical protein D9599_28635 [Roseomonas sp. KE2513]|uniref:hypothetical protein n=1 Tax=Roseomonas sp. KE2513 TaxID=2479202 RepID=UPI0018DF3F60|nr:hypothetical protein [Roseomonas sp. KE2513]MBI0539486.1 hypothetical protein [Roseomonas sp. KE2513]
MTRAKKLLLTGATTLAAGVALMLLLHRLAWNSFNAASMETPWMRGGMGMHHEMPWFMPMGPLAMVLTLTGAVLLVASLARLTTRNG